MTASFPAFKEWHAIVEALGSGEQLLILRKGGISEKRGGFDATHAGRFWLFPTQFHAQSEKTKPAAARFFPTSPASADDGSVTLRYFADITHHAFLADWATVAALDTHHFWTESAVREKFDWAQPPGLHAFVVRVHRLTTPLSLPLTADMGGCKSWTDVPTSFAEMPSIPVLSDEAFTSRAAPISELFTRKNQAV